MQKGISLGIIAVLFAITLSSLSASHAIPALTFHKAAVDLDVEVLEFDPKRPAESGLRATSVSFTIPSTQRSFTAFLATVENPDYFTFKLPPKGCGFKNTTSETASWYGCKYATNAGFFDVATGACLGNIVIDSNVTQAVVTNRVNYGFLSQGAFITGYMPMDYVKNPRNNITQLLSGAGWIIRNGKNYLNESIASEAIPGDFVSEKAPRTAIGNFLNGTLALFQVDGEEDIKEGVGLAELTEIMLMLGFENAVNLDGGGSSTSWYDGKVIDKPTCNDTPVICERPVTTISCVKS